jgi:pyruvate dehydrogenase E1 component alpha subunit
MVLHQKKDPEELEAWRKQDPIQRFQKSILDLQILSLQDIEEMKQRIAGDLDEAERFAEESPWPDPAILREFVEV